MSIKKSEVKSIATKDLDVHSLSMLFPTVNEEDVSALALDIKNNGVVVPLEVWQGKVVDGKHRLAAATACGLEQVPCVEIEGTEDEVVQYIWALNVPRRHLTKTQIAAAIVTIERKYPEAAKEIKRTFNVSKSMVSMVRSLMRKWEGAKDELIAGVALRDVERKANQYVEENEEENELEEAESRPTVTSKKGSEINLAPRQNAESNYGSTTNQEEYGSASLDFYKSENEKINEIVRKLRSVANDINSCKSLENVAFRCDQILEEMISTVKCYKYVVCPRCGGDVFVFCSACDNERYVQQVRAPGVDTDD